MASNYISRETDEFQQLNRIIERNQNLVQQLNTGCAKQLIVREMVGEILNQSISTTTEIRLPFRTDYGANTVIGRHVFINSNLMLVDLGGITIADYVLVGPNVTIISVNHPKEAQYRHDVELNPVAIEKNAWLGANSTILPGVTVGKNAIVAAGAVVTHDVPADTTVAGIPARIIGDHV
ncbi:DapH/DapD/GlmU-related protein [Latilactobacillus sp. 5-91]|uniref:DapH/DapD/GlmU-related protein n=1 Tax=Latilactobacillus sp. 5-91 TaxID=3410924 RepID=UPI003C749A04